MAEPIREPDNISARISNLYNNPRMKLLMDELLYSAEILSDRLRSYQRGTDSREITRIPERTRLVEFRDTAGTIQGYIIEFRNVIVPPLEQGIVPTVPIQLPNMTDQETATINEMKERLDGLVEMTHSLYTFFTSLANGSITPNMQPERTKNQMMEPYSRLARELYKQLQIFCDMIQPRPVPVVMGTTYSIIPIGTPLGGKTMKVKKRRKIRKQKKTKRTNQKKFIKYK